MSTHEPPSATAPGAPPDTVPTPPTLVDLLTERAQQYGDKVVFGFSRDGEDQESNQLTYRELDAHARRVAVELRRQGATGEHVLVLCPPGLDFIAGYFGCLYAGAVAVPVHPPLREHLVPRVKSIIADMRPGFALTTAEIQTKIKATVDDLDSGHALRWCTAEATAAGDPREWVAPDIDADTVAMVQYTSGSTSAPKGVVLTHGNLMHNLVTIQQAWNGDDQAIGVFWLPPFHDMGLIGGLLETIYVGCTTFLMPPTAFIKRPMRWLEAMSRHRGTITVAPNFAYDMCVELSTPEQRAALDLSSWSTAMCGAEPVRIATLQRFAEAFAPAGFAREAFLPVYGLAEGTLLVSGGSDSAVPVVRQIDRAALRDNRIVDVAADAAESAATLVGCGKPRGGQRVVIVDPETRRACRPDGVGEIWISGGSVAHGYWEAPETSHETFAATLSDTGEGPFLRTGDLGFLRDGELYVTGRRKDLIIIRGNNHYPNDIELTVQNCNPALLPGRGAVFSVTPETAGSEQLVVVQEVNHSLADAAELAEMIQAIRTAVTQRHEIRVYAVVLVEPLQLPTTSSGKIQRSTCKQRYTDGELPVVTQWPAQDRETPPEARPAARIEADHPRPGAGQVTDWLIAQLSRDLELPAAQIDPSQSFAFYGLDSIHAVRLTTALEEWLGREFSPTLAYEYPTIDLLAAHVAGGEAAEADTARPAAVENAHADEPIAIVGIGCRFPGADSPAAFWQLLSGGVDATSEVPADRWDADAFYNPDPSVPGTAVTRRGGFLRGGVDGFDYQFFGISPRESAQMDPQQRLLLEVATEALEDAGQVPERLAGSATGVFVGISTNDYGYLRLGQPQLVDAYTGTGNALSIAANRLSYTFDFHGPSMAIDTACSSSLVAVDLACRSLRDGECTLALAGGVNVMLSPALAINFSKAHVMAPDGRCKTFDADADGYVRGEGAGVVVLKPLSRALADNDPVYAVIRGTATNQDGRTNGLIAPSERSQEAVLAAAYRRAGLSPGAVQYVEAHGTGTSLGDAIEAKALGAVLTEGRLPDSRCLVGSVKTNIGHLEAAAGVAGLIKVALALRHRAIPPSLNFTAPNPHIDFDGLPLDVVQTLTPWPDHGGRAVAGVSAFGFGGTNAHVVLTEAPQVRLGPAAHDGSPARAELLPLSARSPEALTALVGEYEMALFSGSSLADLCYTAGARRGHHDYRLAVVGDSPAQLFESFAAYRQGESRPGLSAGHCRPGRPPQVAFVFSGQGSQWLAMGRALAAEEPVFGAALHECDDAIRAYRGRSVLAALADSGDSELTDIGLIQPAIFAVQVALAALWRSWGVQPAAVIGHSMGEVAAAHVAGALSLADAARVIWARSRMLARVHGQGAMLVAEATLAEAEELIAGRQDRVAVAASNSHRSTVLSGDRAVLAEIMGTLQRREKFCRWIDVDAASHSPQLRAMATELRGMLGGLRPTPPTVPIYSTVTGGLLSDRALDPDYWVENLCSPVRFSPALRRLLDAGHHTLVEISPHPILLTAAREDAEDTGHDATLLASMRRDDEGRATMLAALSTLYTLGHGADWERLYPPASRCIPAPTCPWQRTRSWLEAGSIAAPRHAAAGDRWRGPIRSAAHPDTVLAEVDLDRGLTPELLSELALTAVEKAFGPADRVVRDLDLPQPAPSGAASTVQFVVRGDPSAAVSFECYRAEPDWPLLGSGSVAAGTAAITAKLRERIYRLRWQPAPIGTAATDQPAGAGGWLIFGDGGAAADGLRDRLEAHGQSCVLVEPGEDFVALTARHYRIDPARPEHFRRLLEEAFDGASAPCRGVVHLWSLAATEPADALPGPGSVESVESLESAATLGPLSVLYLLQALSGAGWSASPRLWLVTRGTQPAGTGPVAVAGAPVWGLSRSIDHEHPELHPTCVDLSADGGADELSALFDEVWTGGREVDVALRGGARYVARLAHDDDTEPEPAFQGFRPDASYLITGGLGAVGGAVAAWMVEQGARHLVLMGRGEPSAAAQAALEALRSAGAEVTVARGDVTDAGALAAVLESITASMPPLRGVVHAAGTVDDAILAYLDERALRAVLAPKVQGAWNLHALTRDADLDFFVLFSSAASVLGSPGAANYGAANAFLDALAWHRRAAGRPALSINFGPWAGLGMFANSELHRHFTHYGVQAMPAADYLQALSLLLARQATQAVVLDIDWARWRPGSHPPLLAELQAANDSGTAQTPATGLYDALQGAAPAERQGLLEAYLRDLVAGKLGLAPAKLNLATPLNNLGVDSLITLELRIQVERDLGIAVPVARLLDGPSVTSLAGWLSGQLAESVPHPAAAVAAPEIDPQVRVDELSDEAVDEMLRKVLAEGGQR